jgi:hypothetical protein
MGGFGLDISGSGQEPVVCTCEHGNEFSGYLKGEEFHEWLSDSRVFQGIFLWSFLQMFLAVRVIPVAASFPVLVVFLCSRSLLKT